MTHWMYQLSQKGFSTNRYRTEIWEGERWRWPKNKLGKGKQSSAATGDILFFVYAESGGPEPGFSGWAVVLDWADDHVYFRPSAPSDYLKMRPWWDDKAKQLVKDIRGDSSQGTRWPVDDECAHRIREGIGKWVAGGA